MHLVDRRVPCTPLGRDELAAEIAILDHLRQEVLAEHQRCPENSERSTGNELAALDQEISRLLRTLAQAEVLHEEESAAAVGSTVTIAGDWGQRRFTVSGPVNANPRCGCIAYNSPLAQALLGRQVGEEIDIPSPTGRQRLRIVAVSQG